MKNKRRRKHSKRVTPIQHFYDLDHVKTRNDLLYLLLVAALLATAIWLGLK